MRHLLKRFGFKLGLLVAILVSSGSFVAAQIAISPTGSTLNAGGYEFSDVRLTTISFNSTRIDYEQGWAGDTYPGVRDCIWKLYDEKGDLVGEAPQRFTSPNREPEPADVTIPVSAPADTAGINCGERLSDPTAVYDLESLDFIPLTSTSARVSYVAQWTGEGEPDFNRCVLHVLRDGREQATHEFNVVLKTLGATSHNLRFDEPITLEGDYSDSYWECSPF